MPILEILQYPDTRLSRKARTVTEFDAELQTIIDDMLETLYNTENCGGLAATQLNIVNPPRVTVIYDYRESDRPNKKQSLCLVNPEIISRESESLEPEGCMSVSGGVYEPVLRSAKVVAKAFDRDGKPFEIAGEGYMSKLLQHEIDHLNGVIFIDHLSRLKRQRVDKKIFKIKRMAKG